MTYNSLETSWPARKVRSHRLNQSILSITRSRSPEKTRPKNPATHSTSKTTSWINLVYLKSFKSTIRNSLWSILKTPRRINKWSQLHEQTNIKTTRSTTRSRVWFRFWPKAESSKMLKHSALVKHRQSVRSADRTWAICLESQRTCSCQTISRWTRRWRVACQLITITINRSNHFWEKL